MHVAAGDEDEGGKAAAVAIGGELGAPFGERVHGSGEAVAAGSGDDDGGIGVAGEVCANGFGLSGLVFGGVEGFVAGGFVAPIHFEKHDGEVEGGLVEELEFGVLFVEHVGGDVDAEAEALAFDVVGDGVDCGVARGLAFGVDVDEAVDVGGGFGPDFGEEGGVVEGVVTDEGARLAGLLEEGFEAGGKAGDGF